ncbi:hypothetical protein IscW_ISCW023281 [Ixodes scapularis]|uniref:Uncharacterized protein n=1 Tax=Ixodes scapularis TaxID=6945 RepID=B7QIA1_IXOSC|nr:hypothetical protein IscW_ISCW023281 [Ixodes scapularis]|eukprot:XP_002414908.1 hypothetical protein IscW_ISCW023281 [Ixodes scapularis]
MQAVEQRALLLHQNGDQDEEEREFRGQIQAQTKPYAHLQLTSQKMVTELRNATASLV